MKYITQFDGIRALCVIFVLIGHWSTAPIKNTLPWGNLGVYTFFVMSGYLITSILLELKHVIPTKTALVNFWGRRILRIFPVYYLTLLILWLVQHQPVSDYAAWHFTFLSNFLIMSSVGYQGTTDHLWSLAVECQFYLFWPFVILLVKDKHLPYIILSLLILSPVCRLMLYLFGMGSIIKMFTLSSIDFLGIGALVAFSHKNKQFNGISFDQLLQTIFPWATFGFLLIEILRNLGYHNIFLSLIESSCLVFLLGQLINATAKGITGFPKHFLELSAIRFIGRISYGLYLYHLFISYYMTKWFPVFSSKSGIGMAWGRFISFLLVSYLLATLSWFFLEKPMLKLKKYFSFTT